MFCCGIVALIMTVTVTVTVTSSTLYKVLTNYIHTVGWDGPGKERSILL